MNTKEKKRAFLVVYEKNAGNISQACKKVNIDRKTFYNWRKSDKWFNRMAEEIEESLVDFSESKLLQRIAADDTTAIIFHLKTKGKSRGYTEKTDIGLSGELTIELPEALKDLYK